MTNRTAASLAIVIRFTVCVCALLITVTGISIALEAQTSPTPQETLSFDVASIRPTAPTGNTRMQWMSGGRLSAQGITLRELIKRAYGTVRWPDARIIGGPGWIGSQRFDIEAKATGEFGTVRPESGPDGGLPDDVKLRIQHLLADRFAVKIRRESRDQRIYALVVVNEGRLGPKLVPSKADCAGPYDTLNYAMGVGPAKKVACPFTANAGLLKMGASTMADLASMLGFFPVIERVVQDRTGIAGTYDLEVSFVPAFSNGPTGAVIANPQADSGPTLFTAIQDQLGLKLESARGQVDVIFVASAEKPSEN